MSDTRISVKAPSDSAPPFGSRWLRGGNGKVHVVIGYRNEEVYTCSDGASCWPFPLTSWPLEWTPATGKLELPPIGSRWKSDGRPSVYMVTGHGPDGLSVFLDAGHAMASIWGEDWPSGWRSAA